jgi:hypothetical protein
MRYLWLNLPIRFPVPGAATQESSMTAKKSAPKF